MSLSVVLTAEQFALHQAAAGDHPEDITRALTWAPYHLDDDAARLVAYIAWRDRQAWDQWVEHDFGISAGNAEWDPDASTFPTLRRPPEPEREQTAQEAYRVALRAMDVLSRDDDLILLVVRAFLLDMDVAADIACAAFYGRELSTVNLKL